jgi:hypothetical protein
MESVLLSTKLRYAVRDYCCTSHSKDLIYEVLYRVSGLHSDIQILIPTNCCKNIRTSGEAIKKQHVDVLFVMLFFMLYIQGSLHTILGFKSRYPGL